MSRLVAISEVADVNPGFPRYSDLAPESLVSFLPMASVSESGEIITQDERPFGEVSKGYTYFAAGDVLMAKITPCMENGKAIFIQKLKHPVGFGSTEFHVLRPGSEIDGKYLFYMIWNPLFRKEAGRNMTGTAGQKRVPSSFLKDSKIPLPPLPEQKRIAAILDKADSIRRKRQEAVRLTEELRRSVFLEMFGDPVANPKGWPIKRLGEILGSPLQNGAYYPSDLYSEDDREGVEMVHMSDAFYGTVERGKLKRVRASEKDIEKYGLSDADILVARRSLNYEGSVKPCLIQNDGERLIFESSLIRVNPDDNKLLPIYLYHFLNDTKAKKEYVLPYVTKSTISGINQKNLERVEIVVPCLDKQKEFKQFIEKTEKLITITVQHFSYTDTLFNSLLQRAFKGEL
jgi:type I restriction enzyme S subunit